MSASSSSGFGVDFGDGDDRNDVRLLLLLESFEVDSRLRNEPSSSSPLFSSVESLRAVPSPVNPCRLLYDFRRLDRFSCCISSNVGAGLKTVFLASFASTPFKSSSNESLMLSAVSLAASFSSSALCFCGDFDLSLFVADDPVMLPQLVFNCLRLRYSLMDSLRFGGVGAGTLAGGLSRGSALWVRCKILAGNIGGFAGDDTLGPVAGSVNVEYDFVR